MCGRITQNVKLDTLVERYQVRLGADPVPDLTPHYNGGPGRDYVAIRPMGRDRVLVEQCWGQVPEWAQNQPGARRLINARSETVHEKRAFRSAFRQRRCVIPVNGWFEWRPEEGGKQPYWLRPEGAELFSLAGIWEPGSGTPGSRPTFVILTMAAATAIADIHHRQPVILDDDALEAWLRPGWASNELLETVLASDDRAYERRRVSREVASPRNDSPELLAPAVTTMNMHGARESHVALR